MTIETQKLLRAAIENENNGDIIEAMKGYRDVYQADPHNQDAILGLGRIAYSLGKIEYAFDFFVKLLIENHKHPWGYWGRAAVYYEYGQPERALMEIRRAIELDHPATQLRIDCAVLLNEHGHYQEALDSLKALSDEDFDEDAEIEWCYAELKLGEPSTATQQMILSHVDSDIDQTPSIWLMFYGKLMETNDNPQSQAVIDLALQKEPELAERFG